MQQITRRDLLKAGLGAAAVTVAGDPGSAMSAGGHAPFARLRLNFNREFKFQLGDHAGAEAAGYDDGSWDDAGLPHSFSAPYWGETEFYVGYGWYRKSFQVGREWSGKKLFLEFEAAFQDAEVFVNGKLAGGHRGGYTGFSIDITPCVRQGENVLAVRLNNNWNAELAPRAGEHQFSGGMYRNVWLLITAPLHVPYCGTWITTPQVSGQAAVVNVKTQVANDGSSAKKVTVRTRILDPEGLLVAKVETVQAIEPGAIAVFDQTAPAIASPKLWHPGHPHLYTAVNTVYEGGRVVDEVSTPFGIRWFEFTADRGFFLNGEHYLLHGANVHQDHAGWGDAVTSAGIERDVRMVKDAGFNFIRGSHYPHSRAFYNACDRLGVLVWSELCFWGIGGFGKDGSWIASAYPVDPANDAGFEQSCKQQLGEMIVEHRNNPSVVAWSMCNEVFFSDAGVMDKVRALLSGLVSLSHELDPHRPAGIGGCQRGNLDKLGDIAGYNGDGARLFLAPGIASVVTEYGSCGGVRPGDYTPCWGDMAGQPDFPWRSGAALWCMFDHGSVANIGKLGCVDYFRLPKRRWHWYRNANLQIPPPEWPQPGTPAGLRLETDRSTIAGDGTDDCQLIVTVLDAAGKRIADTPPVTLKIVSGPGSFPTGPEIPFRSGTPIPIVDGQAAIEFRSYYAGKTVIQATSPGLQSATIAIATAGVPAFDARKQKRSPVVMTGPKTPKPARQTASKPIDPANPNLALNRPTRASSEQDDHQALDGNDGDINTRWCAADGQPGAWWQIDLENVDTIQRSVVRFEKAANYRYRIDLSMDAETWVTAVDRTKSDSAGQVRADIYPAGAKGRYLRITYTGLPAGSWASHCEVEVYGHTDR